MKSKIFSITILILLLFIVQLGVFVNWQLLVLVNLVLASLIFYTSEQYNINIWWFVLLVGLLFDFFSPLYFGTFIFIYFLVIGGIYFLSKSFFTNKSLYTLLILNLIGSFIFKIFTVLATYFNNFLGFFSWHINLYHIIIAIIFESVFITLWYFIYHSFYKSINE